MEKKHIAMCELVCSSCPAFIATKNNDNELREKTAKEWTERYKTSRGDRPPIKLEEINCHGCLSDGPLYSHCHECEIRKCGLSKEVKNCQECETYMCKKLRELQDNFLK